MLVQLSEEMPTYMRSRRPGGADPKRRELGAGFADVLPTPVIGVVSRGCPGIPLGERVQSAFYDSTRRVISRLLNPKPLWPQSLRTDPAILAQGHWPLQRALPPVP